LRYQRDGSEPAPSALHAKPIRRTLAVVAHALARTSDSSDEALTLLSRDAQNVPIRSKNMRFLALGISTLALVVLVIPTH
jgi:hypothetical protein